MHRGNEILFMNLGLRAQHGCHAKNAQKSQNLWLSILLNLVCSIRDLSSSYEPRMTLTYFKARSILETGFYMGKSENNGFF